MIYIGLGIVILVLLILVCRKTVLDHTEKQQLITEVNNLKQEKENLQQNVNEASTTYNNLLNIINRKTIEAQDFQDHYFADQKEKRQASLDSWYENTKKYYTTRVENVRAQCNAQIEEQQKALDDFIANCDLTHEEYQDKIEQIQQRYNSLLEPIKLYEKERANQEWYTIQIPEKYHSDIDYLLNTVAEKVAHPDIISKLVWTEYIKPSMDATLKRLEIKETAGIYKITNVNNNKAYIGKSVNVKKRLQEHFKSAVGIQSIADQAFHHEILKNGIWNWRIEILNYCDKEQLSEQEKYYIDFFQTQNYGYNKREGG